MASVPAGGADARPLRSSMESGGGSDASGSADFDAAVAAHNAVQGKALWTTAEHDRDGASSAASASGEAAFSMGMTFQVFVHSLRDWALPPPASSVETPLVVFRLLDFPSLVVEPTRADAEADAAARALGTTVDVNAGKSCLFALPADEDGFYGRPAPLSLLLMGRRVESQAGAEAQTGSEGHARLVATAQLDVRAMFERVRRPHQQVAERRTVPLRDLFGRLCCTCELSLRVGGVDASVLPHVGGGPSTAAGAQALMPSASAFGDGAQAKPFTAALEDPAAVARNAARAALRSPSRGWLGGADNRAHGRVSADEAGAGNATGAAGVGPGTTPLVRASAPATVHFGSGAMAGGDGPLAWRPPPPAWALRDGGAGDGGNGGTLHAAYDYSTASRGHGAQHESAALPAPGAETFEGYESGAMYCPPPLFYDAHDAADGGAEGAAEGDTGGGMTQRTRAMQAAVARAHAMGLEGAGYDVDVSAFAGPGAAVLGDPVTYSTASGPGAYPPPLSPGAARQRSQRHTFVPVPVPVSGPRSGQQHPQHRDYPHPQHRASAPAGAFGAAGAGAGVLGQLLHELRLLQLGGGLAAEQWGGAPGASAARVNMASPGGQRSQSQQSPSRTDASTRASPRPRSPLRSSRARGYPAPVYPASAAAAGAFGIGAGASGADSEDGSIGRSGTGGRVGADGSSTPGRPARSRSPELGQSPSPIRARAPASPGGASGAGPSGMGSGPVHVREVAHVHISREGLITSTEGSIVTHAERVRVLPLKHTQEPVRDRYGDSVGGLSTAETAAHAEGGHYHRGSSAARVPGGTQRFSGRGSRRVAGREFPAADVYSSWVADDDNVGSGAAPASGSASASSSAPTRRQVPSLAAGSGNGGDATTAHAARLERPRRRAHRGVAVPRLPGGDASVGGERRLRGAKGGAADGSFVRLTNAERLRVAAIARREAQRREREAQEEGLRRRLHGGDAAAGVSADGSPAERQRRRDEARATAFPPRGHAASQAQQERDDARARAAAAAAATAAAGQTEAGADVVAGEDGDGGAARAGASVPGDARASRASSSRATVSSRERSKVLRVREKQLRMMWQGRAPLGVAHGAFQAHDDDTDVSFGPRIGAGAGAGAGVGAGNTSIRSASIGNSRYSAYDAEAAEAAGVHSVSLSQSASASAHGPPGARHGQSALGLFEDSRGRIAVRDSATTVTLAGGQIGEGGEIADGDNRGDGEGDGDVDGDGDGDAESAAAAAAGGGPTLGRASVVRFSVDSEAPAAPTGDVPGPADADAHAVVAGGDGDGDTAHAAAATTAAVAAAAAAEGDPDEDDYDDDDFD